MFLAELDINTILNFGTALITSGALAGGVLFGIRRYKEMRKAWKENPGLLDKTKAMASVIGDSLEEGEQLMKQIMALSKAAQDSDKAVSRITANEKMRQEMMELASKFSEEDQKALAQVLTPVKSGIRHYAGQETGKLTELQKAMEDNLTTQETRNRVMTNSAKMAVMVAKSAVGNASNAASAIK